jgi:hypothetical protein
MAARIDPDPLVTASGHAARESVTTDAARLATAPQPC